MDFALIHSYKLGASYVYQMFILKESEAPGEIRHQLTFKSSSGFLQDPAFIATAIVTYGNLHCLYRDPVF